MSDMRNVNGATRGEGGCPPALIVLWPVNVAADAAGGSGSRAGPGTAGGLLCRRLPRNRWCLGNRQRQATKFAAAGDTDTPRKLRLISRAFVANFETLRAVGPAAIALDATLGASKAVIRSTTSGGTSSALTGSSSVLDVDGLLSGGRHIEISRISRCAWGELTEI